MTSVAQTHLGRPPESVQWSGATTGDYHRDVSYLAAHALTVLTALSSIVIAIRLLGSRRSPQSTIAWLLALVFVPFVAIPLYLALGGRKFPRRAKTSSLVALAGGTVSTPDPGMTKLLAGSGVAPPSDGNTFELVATGEDAYARLIELVRGAKRSIDLTMFIVGSDATGHAIIDALASRARDGVAVRVVLDAVGCARVRHHATRVLAAARAEVRIFMPFWHSPIHGRDNLRNHRKLAVFDGTHVFLGGMNLAAEYMGPPDDGAARWVDVAAIVTGPVAGDATRLFESDWVFCGGATRETTATPPGEAGRELAQVVPSGPDMTNDTVYDLFLDAIYGARERIALVTPYYVPDDSLQHALVIAARRGVRVDLVVPARSNHFLADMAGRRLMCELAAAGVGVRYYEHGMVHAKAMVVDDSFAYVGSPNFDMRSLFLNYEVALCVYSSGAIGQIRGFIDALAAKCTRDKPVRREFWLIDQIASLLAPEL
jgi:cardiolipin synthase